MTTNPIAVERVVGDPALCHQLEAFFAILRATNAPVGGLTLRAVRDRHNDDRPRALVYSGPLPVEAEHAMRPSVQSDYGLSHVRDFDPHDRNRTRTATADNRLGY